jgi:hypothetical protein
MKRMAMCLAAIAGALGFAAVAFAQPTQTIRGEVVSLQGNDLHLKSAAGQESVVKLSGGARVSIRGPARLESIKAGDFVGTTASPGPNGTLVASEVHIFPESMRGRGEGHHSMARMPGSTMTNATVSGVSGAPAKASGTMTNATVANVDTAAKGRTLKLTYKGGKQTLFVADNVPVVRTEPGSRDALTKGAQVIVYASRGSNGGMNATRISVGKNGSTPPI